MKRMNRRAFIERAALAAGAGLVLGAAAKVDTPGVQVSPHVHALPGAVNTGVLVGDGVALLFDCCDSVNGERLAALGVKTVEMICCTQHRRPNVAGAYPFVESGAQLAVPAGERGLFDDVGSYWNNWKNRWHLYHSHPGPQVLARPVSVARSVAQDDVIEWRGFRIKVMDTPGATDGSVSYVMDDGAATVGFCGDAMYGPGQVWELYSLQKGFGAVGDYHGFLGARAKLILSLRKLAASGAPARGR